MTRKLILVSTLVAAFAGGGLMAGAASAQDMAALMKAREAHYKEIGKAFKGVLDEFKKPEPSVADIQKYTAVLDKLAPQVPTWFPVGSGPESGNKTQALATIWEKPAEFKKDAADFASAAHALNVAALSGALDSVALPI